MTNPNPANANVDPRLAELKKVLASEGTVSTVNSREELQKQLKDAEATLKALDKLYDAKAEARNAELDKESKALEAKFDALFDEAEKEYEERAKGVNELIRELKDKLGDKSGNKQTKRKFGNVGSRLMRNATR